MPNRRRFRRIKMPPSMEGFKPFGIPMRKLESVNLLFEEYEALRLADYENLNHEEAAKRMNISRPTFTRLYDKARKSIAKAFVEGKSLVIEGGNVEFGGKWHRCGRCNRVMNGRHRHNQYCGNCKKQEIDESELTNKDNQNENSSII